MMPELSLNIFVSPQGLRFSGWCDSMFDGHTGSDGRKKVPVKVLASSPEGEAKYLPPAKAEALNVQILLIYGSTKAVPPDETSIHRSESLS